MLQRAEECAQSITMVPVQKQTIKQVIKHNLFSQGC